MARQRLYEIVDNDKLTVADKQKQMLALGLEYFQADNGHIQVPDASDETHTIAASVGADIGGIETGETLDRTKTYCRRTLEQHSPLALSDAGSDGWDDDPAYREHGFDCYLGTTIFVEGEAYGTVCFVGEDPREKAFTDEEEMFLELLARLLGREIEATKQTQQLAAVSTARHRAEDKFEALLQMAPDAIILFESDSGDIIDANEQAAALTDYTQAALENQSIFDLHPDGNRDTYREFYATHSDGETREQLPDGSTLCVQQADGSDTPVEISTKTVTVGTEQIGQAIIRDITARQNRKQALERQTDFLQQTQTAADLGGWEYDCESETLRWTEQVYRIHGLEPEYTPTVEDAIELYHPDDRSEIREAFSQLVTEGEPYDTEVRIVTADETVRWVRAIGVPRYDDTTGSLTAVRGVLQDITERKHREKDLRVKNRAIEEASVGITIADATTDELPLVYVNDAFEQLTGYDRDDVRGENCRFLQGPATDPDTTDALRTALADKEAIQTQLRNYRKDGTPFWNDLTLSPVSATADAGVSHFVGFQRDVTATKRRGRLIGMLNRVLRHNLRNRTTVIRGQASHLAQTGDAEVTEAAEEIIDAADELISLSEKARSIETMVSESESLSSRDVVSDIESVVTGLETEYPAVDISLDAPDTATVRATDQLRIALRELGDNAARHTTSDVQYRVRTTDDGFAIVEVCDAGDGIAETEKQVLENGTESPLEHGTGLGHWIVNWIITGLGGELTVTTTDGTTVRIRLPLADGDTRAEQSTSTPE